MKLLLSTLSLCSLCIAALSDIVPSTRIVLPSGECPAETCAPDCEIINQVLLLQKWQLSKVTCKNRQAEIYNCDRVVEAGGECTAEIPVSQLPLLYKYWVRKQGASGSPRALAMRNKCYQMVKASKMKM